MAKISGIYGIVNKINGKIYIGSSVDIHKRWCGHKNNLKNKIHSNRHLQYAWHKYGADVFEFSILEWDIIEEDLLVWEQRYLDFYKKKYNICKIAGNTLGRKLTLQAKQKMSKAKKGKKLSLEHRINMGNARKGATHSEKSKEKIALSKLGKRRKPFSEERLENMSKAHQGEKHGRAKLKNTQILEIRQYLENGLSQQKIANIFDISRSAVKHIKNGYAWTHIK